jgi:hypothetical protein
MLLFRTVMRQLPAGPTGAGLHRGGSATINSTVSHVFRKAILHLMLAILSVAAFGGG